MKYIKAVHNWNIAFYYFSIGKFLVLFSCCQLSLSQTPTKQAMKKLKQNTKTLILLWTNFTNETAKKRPSVDFVSYLFSRFSVNFNKFISQTICVKREWTPKRVKNELANSTVCILGQ